MAETYTHTTWRVKPGSEDEFIRRWKEWIEWSHLQGLGPRARLLRDAESPSTFVSFGPWMSTDAVKNWRAAARLPRARGAPAGAARGLRAANAGRRRRRVSVKAARYDGLAAWYEEFRPALSPDETRCARAAARARARDGVSISAAGPGVALEPLRQLGWSVVGTDVSEDLLEVARRARHGDGARLRRRRCRSTTRASTPRCRSGRTRTSTTSRPMLGELARVLRPEAPFVYIGAHPCFVGPHSRFFGAKGVPELHEGYCRAGRYDDGPGHSSLRGCGRGSARRISRSGHFIQAFLDGGFTIEQLRGARRRRIPVRRRAALPAVSVALGGTCAGVDRHAQLLHEAEVVPVVPDLRHLAVFEAKDVDAGERCALAGRRAPSPYCLGSRPLRRSDERAPCSPPRTSRAAYRPESAATLSA